MNNQANGTAKYGIGTIIILQSGPYYHVGHHQQAQPPFLLMTVECYPDKSAKTSQCWGREGAADDSSRYIRCNKATPCA